MHKLRLPKQKAVIRDIVLSLVFLLSSFVLCSCSPQKRLERLIEKYPELIFNDTISYIAPIAIPEVNAEFLINYTYKDSLITLYSQDSVKLTYTKINDSIIKVFIHVPADTIYYPVTIPIEKIKIIKPDSWGMLIEKIPYVALSIVALFLTGLFFRKK